MGLSDGGVMTNPTEDALQVSHNMSHPAPANDAAVTEQARVEAIEEVVAKWEVMYPAACAREVIAADPLTASHAALQAECARYREALEEIATPGLYGPRRYVLARKALAAQPVSDDISS
jgi:hypothetical protein